MNSMSELLNKIRNHKETIIELEKVVENASSDDNQQIDGSTFPVENCDLLIKKLEGSLQEIRKIIKDELKVADSLAEENCRTSSPIIGRDGDLVADSVSGTNGTCSPDLFDNSALSVQSLTMADNDAPTHADVDTRMPDGDTTDTCIENANVDECSREAEADLKDKETPESQSAEQCNEISKSTEDDAKDDDENATCNENDVSDINENAACNENDATDDSQNAECNENEHNENPDSDTGEAKSKSKKKRKSKKNNKQNSETSEDKDAVASSTDIVKSPRGPLIKVIDIKKFTYTDNSLSTSSSTEVTPKKKTVTFDASVIILSSEGEQDELGGKKRKRKNKVGKLKEEPVDYNSDNKSSGKKKPKTDKKTAKENESSDDDSAESNSRKRLRSRHAAADDKKSSQKRSRVIVISESSDDSSSDEDNEFSKSKSYNKKGKHQKSSKKAAKKDELKKLALSSDSNSESSDAETKSPRPKSKQKNKGPKHKQVSYAAAEVDIEIDKDVKFNSKAYVYMVRYPCEKLKRYYKERRDLLEIKRLMKMSSLKRKRNARDKSSSPTVKSSSDSDKPALKKKPTEKGVGASKNPDSNDSDSTCDDTLMDVSDSTDPLAQLAESEENPATDKDFSAKEEMAAAVLEKLINNEDSDQPMEVEEEKGKDKKSKSKSGKKGGKGKKKKGKQSKENKTQDGEDEDESVDSANQIDTKDTDGNAEGVSDVSKKDNDDSLQENEEGGDSNQEKEKDIVNDTAHENSTIEKPGEAELEDRNNQGEDENDMDGSTKTRKEQEDSDKNPKANSDEEGENKDSTHEYVLESPSKSKKKRDLKKNAKKTRKNDDELEDADTESEKQKDPQTQQDSQTNKEDQSGENLNNDKKNDSDDEENKASANSDTELDDKQDDGNDDKRRDSDKGGSDKEKSSDAEMESENKKKKKTQSQKEDKCKGNEDDSTQDPTSDDESDPHTDKAKKPDKDGKQDNKGSDKNGEDAEDKSGSEKSKDESDIGEKEDKGNQDSEGSSEDKKDKSKKKKKKSLDSSEGSSEEDKEKKSQKTKSKKNMFSSDEESDWAEKNGKQSSSENDAKKKNNSKWRRDKLLTDKLSSPDSEEEFSKFCKKKEKYKQKVLSESEDDKKKEKKKRKVKRRAKAIVSDSESDAWKKSSSNNSSSDSSSESEKDKKKEEPKNEKPRKRRIKKLKDSSSEDGDEKSTRKTIRRVWAKDSLAETTKQAEADEKARKARISEKQKKYNHFYALPNETAAKVDKLVLDFNEETKEELLCVNEELVEKLKPHQASGIQFMWDACFESLDRAKKTEGSGCILAHCMGLGKTLQVVGLTHTLLVNEEVTGVRKVLVVCPLSTVLNWVAEYKKWMPDEDDVEVYELVSCRANERHYEVQNWHNTGGVMVIGYNMFRTLTNIDNRRVNKKIRQQFKTAFVDPGPDLVVCDEGHLLKNEKSHLSIAMNRLRTMRRIVLTGTPLQNNLREYFCMVQFIKPNLLGTYKEYLNRFVNPITNGQYTDSTLHDIQIMRKRSHVLHKLLDGVVQRRDYSVLAPYLPQKHEYVLFLSLSEKQEKLYGHYIRHLARRGGDAPGSSGRSNSTSFLFVDFQELQGICSHPRILVEKKINKEKRDMLVEDDEDSEGSLKDFIDDKDSSASTPNSSSDENDDNSNDDKKGDSSGSDKKKSKQPVRKRVTRAAAAAAEPEDVEFVDLESVQESTRSCGWWNEYCNDDDMESINNSTKLLLLFNILKECEQIGDKVLIFSQSLYSLSVIEHFLAKIDEATQDGNDIDGFTGSWALGLDYFRLDGSSSCDNRSSWCNTFNDPNNTRARLFLISTRAGGLGINLVAANRVIIFDVSWNPSHDIQSIYRVYRFGQNKPCYIYRFVTYGTMEMKIYERQVTKQAISKRVIDEQQIDRHYNQNDLTELYKFEPQMAERPIPLVPKDVLLGELIQKYENQILSYHEHQTLLENKEDEELDEEERKAAWEEFESEKVMRKYSTPNPGMGGFVMTPEQITQALDNIIRRDNPSWSPDQVKAMMPTLVKELESQMEKGNMSLYQKIQREVQQLNLIQAQKIRENWMKMQMLRSQQSIMNNPNMTPEQKQAQIQLMMYNQWKNTQQMKHMSQMNQLNMQQQMNNTGFPTMPVPNFPNNPNEVIDLND